MKNREFASLLLRIADILELKGIQWKPQAYRRAARGIESLDKDINDIYRKEGTRGLENIPGVGSAIAMHMTEFLQNGHVRKFDKLMKEFPKGKEQLLEIQGLGPKKVKKLSETLGIKNINDLRKAVNQHKIREIEGFGEKTEVELAKSLEMYEGNKERMLLGQALPIANEIISYLRNNTPVKRVVYAGSLRRMSETIGDIDILVTSSIPETVMEGFTSMEQVRRVLAKGSTKSSVVISGGIQIDIRIVPEESFAAALQYFTGNKYHNVSVRKVAISKGYKLSEYGLFSGGKPIPCKEEKDIYRKLGFDYIPPELREERGELEAARKHKLPKLIKPGDIKGDMQMHTKASDGENTIKEMMSAAKKLGYEYIAITDHSISTRIAHGLDEKRLRRQWKEIDSVRGKGIEILRGAEVEIKSDGSLDYPAKLLKELDIVVAAVHSGFKSSQEMMTRRIVKAFESGYVTLFAHPTGRIIGKREPYNVNLDKMFQAARDNDVIMEINADPHRLDLNDAAIMKAREFGIRFAINTDAHTDTGLDNMKYGVAQARRGWLESRNVVNTMKLQRLRKLLDR
jgi:DNA polymerase (family 10)